nr:dATP/dGTP pyrophosphohydrolase domain-containing protein [Klebsiella aerogenes]
MTINQLTKEWLQQTIAELESVRDEIPFGIDTNSELELAAFKLALAAMDSEPVVYTDERNLGYIDRGRETAYLWGKQNSEASDVALYRHAQPSPERDQVRNEHAEWSQTTFGDVGPVGPLKHLSKEAPVVPDAATAIRACLSEFPESARDIVEECADIAENACRAAMLQEFQKSAGAANNCRSNEKVQELQAGNSPVIPDGYVMVPKEPTAEMVKKCGITLEGMTEISRMDTRQCSQPPHRR